MQIDLDGEARDRLLALASLVRDDDLGDDGREDKPHVTVRYGLHEDDPEAVRKLLAGFGPIRFALGGVSLFERRDEGKSYDVVKVDVAGEDLHRLNAKLATLPHTQTHPTYNPHATIAYVKPGMGPKYVQVFAPLRLSVEADRLTFSNSERQKHSISLAGVQAFDDAPNPVLPFDQVAPAGVDGVRAAQLLQAAKDHGNRIMAMVSRRAVKRLLANPRRAAYVDHFFDADELAVIRKALEATTATANLLGRSRIRERSRHLLESQAGVSAFAEGDAFVSFVDPPPPLPPTQALDYFQSLVPELAMTPETFGPMLRRKAFTMAFKSDEFMLSRVQKIIGDALATGRLSGGPADIDDVLTRAGVSPRNPQYPEMVFRTNMMDSYNQGAAAELRAPDVAPIFPVWQYLGIKDGRQGKDHEPHFDRFYEPGVSFPTVRGERVFNCRCSFRGVDKFEWLELQKKGATIERR